MRTSIIYVMLVFLMASCHREYFTESNNIATL